MGGLVALHVSLELREDELDGMVLQNPLIKPAGASMPGAPQRLLANLVNMLMPELPLVKGNKGKNARPEINEEFCADAADNELVYTGWLRVGTGLALQHGFNRIQKKLNRIRTPFILQHGTDDLAVGIEGSEELYKKAPSMDKTYKRYPGAHHALYVEDEVTRNKVADDYIAWLNKHTEMKHQRGKPEWVNNPSP